MTMKAVQHVAVYLSLAVSFTQGACTSSVDVDPDREESVVQAGTSGRAGVGGTRATARGTAGRGGTEGGARVGSGGTGGSRSTRGSRGTAGRSATTGRGGAGGRSTEAEQGRGGSGSEEEETEGTAGSGGEAAETNAGAGGEATAAEGGTGAAEGGTGGTEENAAGAGTDAPAAGSGGAEAEAAGAEAPAEGGAGAAGTPSEPGTFTPPFAPIAVADIVALDYVTSSLPEPGSTTIAGETGTAYFTETEDDVTIVVHLETCTPANWHPVLIHAGADCATPETQGEVWTTEAGAVAGGDIPDVACDDDGTGTIVYTHSKADSTPWSLDADPATGLIGRTLIIRASGSGQENIRVACGTITAAP